jgi:transposase
MFGMPSDSHKRNYHAASVDDEAKTALAQLYLVQAKRGTTRVAFRADMAAAGIVVSKAQFDRYVAAVAAGGTAIANEKGSGRRAKLTQEQLTILWGWVLDRNFQNQRVDLAGLCATSQELFGVSLSAASASSYLAKGGFASRTTGNRTAGFRLDQDQQRQLLWDWVRGMDFPSDRQRFCSVDFTYTSQRNLLQKTFSLSGTSQPKVERAISRYTNCIVTCVWADGANRTPSVLFTYNSAFRTDRNPTARRTEIVKHLEREANRLQIDLDRIVYVGAKTGETRTFVQESSDLLKSFFTYYRVPEGSVALSDYGSAFSGGVLDALGFSRHVQYPPAVHQYLSPNDNNLHGAAKQLWRQSGVDFCDDVSSSLLLLQRLDAQTVAHSRSWFEHNMLNLTEDGAASLISGAGERASDLSRERIRAYRAFVGEDASDWESPE